jgi:hypothetical protein
VRLCGSLISPDEAMARSIANAVVGSPEMFPLAVTGMFLPAVTSPRMFLLVVTSDAV